MQSTRPHIHTSSRDLPQVVVLEGSLLQQIPVDSASDVSYDTATKTMSTDRGYGAFVALYNEQKDTIYNFFYYRVNHDVALAEDLTSDTFLKAFENFESYDEEYAFSTWVGRIARNTLIDHFRKSGRQVAIEEDQEFADEESESFVSIIDEQIDIERVKGAMNELPHMQRVSIHMKYFEYKDTKEIAKEHDAEESAVRKNISRGLSRMRELLAALLVFITF